MLNLGDRVQTAKPCGIVTGTRLLTPDGYRPIEILKPGDPVAITAKERSAFQPILWIGRRDVIFSRRHRSDLPVRIRRNAIADGVPNRDVFAAQGHAVHIDGALYRLGNLVNGGSIVLEKKWKSIIYWAIRLEQHAIILADGMPLETLRPGLDHDFTGVQTAPPAVASIEPVAPSSTILDLDTEIRSALNTHAGLLAEHLVRVQIALQPRVMARMPRERFQDIFGPMLLHAVTARPGGRVLITAMRQANGAQVSVTHEDGATDRQTQEAHLRRPQEIAALQGAKLEVDVRPGISTTLQLRLLDA
ncbi:MAG TPA: Hint domain-containing protein [Rhodopila sp.]|nr:Hint domain-containing protein [Rhodopila sp.]